MDLKAAVRYQFSERAKSELIICSQLAMALPGFSDDERPGAKRMLIMVIERYGLSPFAFREPRWRNSGAPSTSSEAISLPESDQYGAASLKLSESISAVTTVAQGAWEVLSSMDSSDFYQFLTTRSSVRDYTREEIGDDEIAYLLDSAATAPSAGNLDLGTWCLAMQTEGRLSEPAFGQPQVREAPASSVVCANYVRSMSRYGERGILYAVQDATIAGTYLMLAAHVRNRPCWVGAFDDEEVKGILSRPTSARSRCSASAIRGNQ